MTSRVVFGLLALCLAARADDVGIDQRLGERVPPDLRFVDSEGREVALASLLDGRPAVLALVYYGCPRLCTLVLNGLTESLQGVPLDPGEDFRVVAVSIDPAETPALAAEKRASYVRRYARPGTEDGWSFLTGDEASVRALADAVGYRYRYDPSTGLYVHAAGVVLVTPDGRLSRYFYGVRYPSRDLRLGLVEAAGGGVGSLADRLLLLCYRYDPETGRYGFAILGALRAGGVLTVLALAFFVVRAVRRERRAAP